MYAPLVVCRKSCTVQACLQLKYCCLLRRRAPDSAVINSPLLPCDHGSLVFSECKEECASIHHLTWTFYQRALWVGEQLTNWLAHSTHAHFLDSHSLASVASLLPRHESKSERKWQILLLPLLFNGRATFRKAGKVKFIQYLTPVSRAAVRRRRTVPLTATLRRVHQGRACSFVMWASCLQNNISVHKSPGAFADSK